MRPQKIVVRPFSSREEILWAAGLFEGEGWFHVYGHTPQMGIQMSDLDVLQKFQGIVGCGTIYYRKPRIYSYERIKSRKEQWAWRTSSFEITQTVAAYLWPWLSRRRQLKLREILEVSKS